MLKYEKWDLGGGCCEGKESVWLDIALDEKAFGAPDRLATVGTGKHSVISLADITGIIALTFLLVCRTRHVRNRGVHYVLGVRLGQRSGSWGDLIVVIVGNRRGKPFKSWATRRVHEWWQPCRRRSGRAPWTWYANGASASSYTLLASIKRESNSHK